MSIAKFISKYAVEAVAVSDALATLANGIALTPGDRATVLEKIEVLRSAALSIANGGKIADAKIVIQKEDIESAVAAKLPALLPSTKEMEVMLRAIVKEELAEITKPEAEKTATKKGA